ncbi:UPF0716 protein FxsA [Stackebrandtia albiflava]|uniref:UPF0716 protein FxsA n=1 Tax=Stackebrandtia albiflava TaxID=406432 RepID=A0A562VD14_9ACTN|nr:FxsA family protein [Stackebrandtia albiflava]TWJ15783.1 UPF0716 protein FxsA [Stackebrandtia albiflava]
MTVPQPQVGYRTRVTLAVYLAAELAAFVGVALWIGFGWSVFAMIVTGLLGGVLLRFTGVKAMREYRQAILDGDPPGPAVVSGALSVAGSVMLMLPGFVSDLAGLLCVLPGTRSLLRPVVARFLERRMDSPSMNRFFGPRVVRPQWGGGDTVADDGEVIEGEVVDAPPPRRDDPEDPDHRRILP